MSLEISSSSAPTDWITPEEQMLRLGPPMTEELANKLAEELVNDLRDKGYIFPKGPLVQKSIIECATRSLLRRSDSSKKSIPSLMDLAVEQLLGPNPLPKNLTDWNTSLSRLNVRLEKIPPLPEDFHQIMDSKCPIYDDQVQRDGTYLKVKDTHFLSLIPKEFGTLNRLESDILRPYGEREYAGQENPLQFRAFWDEARQEHGDIPFPDTYWVLMTKDVLPGSRSKTWGEQVALVDALRQKTLVNYERPTLQESLAAITAYMVATGERRYQSSSSRWNDINTYTLVKETTGRQLLIVGGFSPSGVCVCDDPGFPGMHIGVAALRRFY